MSITLDRRQRTLVQRLAEIAREVDAPRLREQLTSGLADRKALVGLIEEMVAADSQLAEMAPSVGALLRSRIAADAVTATFMLEPAAAEDLDDAYAPDDILRIGRVRGQAEAAILGEPMLDPAHAAASMGSTSRNPREFARQLRARTDILALRVGNRYLFPAFQFNEARRELWPIAAEINGLLGATADPWGVASFWFARDARLGARPADLAADRAREDDIRAAAQRELAPIG
jgi:hypothetical protein